MPNFTQWCTKRKKCALKCTTTGKYRLIWSLNLISQKYINIYKQWYQNGQFYKLWCWILIMEIINTEKDNTETLTYTPLCNDREVVTSAFVGKVFSKAFMCHERSSSSF